MTLENPIRAIRDISHDMTCRRRVRLANGREVSALDIQREYLDRALRYADDQGLPAARAEGAGDVGALRLDDRERSAEARPRGRLGHQVPAASRPSAPVTTCRSATPGCSCSTCSTTTSAASRSPFYKLQDRGMVERVCTDADIETAVDVPPQTTRARLRGEFIRKAKERKRDYTVDWVHLKLNDQAQRTVLCKDPFKSRDERVEKLIESL